MKYKNVTTGEIRDFTCTLNSKYWEPIEAPVTIKKKVDEVPVKKTKKTK